jgi:hypothetical protein
MNRVLDIVASETNGKCYSSFRYCADEEIRLPTLDFDTRQNEVSIIVKEYGENDKSLSK